MPERDLRGWSGFSAGADVEEPDTCPTCGRRKATPKNVKLEPARPKVRIRVDVPVDERENGFTIFHSLLDQAREQLGRPEGTPAYFTLIEILHFFLTTPKERAA